MGLSTGAYIAITAATALTGAAVYSSIDNAKHAKTDASDASNVATDNANAEIKQANDQKTASQNATANNTAAAQARVRAISNPDGNTIMTSPLGSVGAGPTNPFSGPGPSPGSVATPGKQTIGG